MDFVGMSRTFNPKYTHYLGDGSGRDSYIVTNNGGLFPLDGLCIPFTGYNPKPQSQNLFANQNTHNTSCSPLKEATSLRYYGDGSGRDGYVISNFGGLVKTYKSKDALRSFYNSLRQNTESNNKNYLKKKGDYLAESQNWYSPKIQMVLRESYQQQQNLSNRLATPKLYLRSNCKSPTSNALINLVENNASALRYSLKTASHTNRNLNKSTVIYSSHLNEMRDDQLLNQSTCQNIDDELKQNSRSKSPMLQIRNKRDEIQLSLREHYLKKRQQSQDPFQKENNTKKQKRKEFINLYLHRIQNEKQKILDSLNKLSNDLPHNQSLCLKQELCDSPQDKMSKSFFKTEDNNLIKQEKDKSIQIAFKNQSIKEKGQKITVEDLKEQRRQKLRELINGQKTNKFYLQGNLNNSCIIKKENQSNERSIMKEKNHQNSKIYEIPMKKVHSTTKQEGSGAIKKEDEGELKGDRKTNNQKFVIDSRELYNVDY